MVVPARPPPAMLATTMRGSVAVRDRPTMRFLWRLMRVHPSFDHDGRVEVPSEDVSKFCFSRVKQKQQVSSGLRAGWFGGPSRVCANVSGEVAWSRARSAKRVAFADDAARGCKDGARDIRDLSAVMCPQGETAVL